LTIQKAIDASQTSNGHTIEVKADTYYENVVVDKDLTIIGEDPNTTIIDGNHISTKNVVTIETATATISGFTIQHGPRSGIKVHLSPPGVTIIGNIITHNFVGISIEDYTQNVQIVDNVLANQYGIYLKNTENNIINSNIMSDNGYAITLSQSDGNTIKENTISNSGYSIYVGSSSDNNVIHHNNFINSTSGPVSSGSNNAWDDGYPSGGNYWSDYNGTDLYSGPYQNETGSDGIGDTPYVIDANDQDNYPLIRPWGSIRNIDTGLIYLTIQKAIDASQTSNGHTIEVKAGTYYENVVVDKSLTLIGENTSTTIIDGSGTGNVVTVQANSSSIRRFTIQNGQYGIYVKQNSNIYIDNNTVSNNQGGICLWRSINCSVSSNTVSNNRDIVSGPGIMIYNYMPGLGVGNHAVTDNIVIDNYDGIRVHSSRDNVICGNIVANNTHDGIYLDGGKYNNITENWVSNNYYGINLYASYDNVIYHNNFINNTNQAYQSESPFQLNAWDDGYPSGGNYWSDYNGTDLYSGPYQNETGSDGIGDTSYEINQYNQDNYPLKDPWNGYYWYLLYEPWNQLASWTKEGTGVSNIAIKDGKNCLRNKPNKSNYVTQYKDVGTLPETGYTAETSLYVDSWGDGDPESFVAFKFYDGMHRVTIEIHSDRVVGAQNNLSVQTNATQWYTWRFLIDSDADTIDVYRDGQHVGTLTGLTDSTANDGLVHCAWTQNPSESNGCESYTDYIKIAPGLHTPS
jgi:parallel beta-helix repeat protein